VNETKTLVFGFDLFLSCQSGPVASAVLFFQEVAFSEHGSDKNKS